MNSTEKITSIQAFSKFFAILLFGGALFIFSIGSLSADSNDKTFSFPDKLAENDISTIQSSNGKYMMQMEVYKNNEGVPQWIILVWDTQTGKSKLYSKDKDKGTIPAHSGWNMPANPL
jgi:hypothetical protein